MYKAFTGLKKIRDKLPDLSCKEFTTDPERYERISEITKGHPCSRCGAECEARRGKKL